MARITLLGGGSSAHALAALLGEKGHEITIISRRPERWSDNVTISFVNPDGDAFESKSSGRIRIAQNPAEGVRGAQAIILCMPVSEYRNALDWIGPSLSGKHTTYIGPIFGQAGFDWMWKEVTEKHRITNNFIPFAVGLLPWVVRTTKYGSNVNLYTAEGYTSIKRNNLIAIGDSGDFTVLHDLFLRDISSSHFGRGDFIQTDCFLSLTLSVDNQIIHTARLKAIAESGTATWSNATEIPFFYKDWNEQSTSIIRCLDGDYTKVRSAIRHAFPEKYFTGMMNYEDLEEFSYGRTSGGITRSFTESTALGAIKVPTSWDKDLCAWTIDKTHRFFRDDIYYGLVIAKWFALQFQIDVPTIDGVLEWAQLLLKTSIIDENSEFTEHFLQTALIGGAGIPPAYNINSTRDIFV